MVPETWTVEQAATAIADGDAVEPFATILREKQERGSGIAVYRNEDLGHPEVGRCVGLTYGQPEAQFEGDPPEQCPDGLLRDITGGINWRFRLAAIVPPVNRDLGGQ